MKSILKIKGRGAQINTRNKFLKHEVTFDTEYSLGQDEFSSNKKTRYLSEHSKSIVNQIKSPDLPSGMSVNPYQGCEHGCVYCYARNSHEYYGYSAGLEFEQNILIKKNAPLLLENEFNKKSWLSKPILFSGNTDCYQVAEKKYELTRKMLIICLKYKNPLAIITKNAMILRDLDILKELSKLNLVHVIISITTLNEQLRRQLEPRTVSAKKRLQVLRVLSENDIPAGVNLAPIIPGLNDHEIAKMLKLAVNNGACWSGYSVIRLNGSVASIFKDWIYKSYPNKADKVLNQIKQLHDGKLNDSQFGRRMTGEGVYAEHIKQLFTASLNKYLPQSGFPAYDFNIFSNSAQLRLF